MKKERVRTSLLRGRIGQKGEADVNNQSAAAKRRDKFTKLLAGKEEEKVDGVPDVRKCESWMKKKKEFFPEKEEGARTNLQHPPVYEVKVQLREGRVKNMGTQWHIRLFDGNQIKKEVCEKLGYCDR